MLSEWNPKEVINHSPDAIKSMQYFAEFIGNFIVFVVQLLMECQVNEARKSDHHYPSAKAEYDALIYNYSPIYSEAIVSDFEQSYVF
jgi:hypothetical protein